MAETVQHPTVLDSTQQYLGKVYAKALLGAAENAGNVEQVLDEFETVQAEILDGVPEFERTLASPRVALESKLSILDRTLQGQVSGVLLNFLRVVIRHRRFDCVRAMYQASVDLHNATSGVVEVQALAASPLSATLQQQVTERLQAALGRQVKLNVVVDDSLIGGLILRVGDTVYDGSVRGRLDGLLEQVADAAALSVRQESERFEIEETA